MRVLKAGVRRLNRLPLWLRVSGAAAATTALAAVAVSLLSYRMERDVYFDGLDERLVAAASAVPRILPPDYHQRIAREEPIDDTEYTQIVQRLRRYAEETDLPYVYTYTLRGGVTHISAIGSSQVTRDQEIAEFHFMTPDPAPPPGLIETLRDGQMRFRSYTTRFGSFRSVFIAHGEGAARYAACADLLLDDVASVLKRRLMTSLSVGALVAVIVGGLGAALGAWISVPINRLTQLVNRLDIRPDDGAIVDPFTEIDRALDHLARTRHDETGRLAMAIESMRVRLRRSMEDVKRVTADNERIGRELEIARTIQRGLLPNTPPRAEGFEIAGWYRAAERVGGDFYDWHELSGPDRQSIVLILADVTGHGIGPAILAAVCRAYARAAFRPGRAPAEAMDRINQLLLRDLTEGRFITLVAVVLDPQANRVTLISAGHGPILLHRAASGQIVELGATGIPLGIAERWRFDEPIELDLEAGDALVLMSDGFHEFMNARREQTGVPRIKQAITSQPHRSANQLIESMVSAVRDFAQGAPQKDDMAALVIRRSPLPQRTVQEQLDRSVNLMPVGHKA